MIKKLSDLKNEWINKYKKPLIISGPCSVESEKQINSISYELKKIGVEIIRGGIWKPRTQPGNFEGIGEIGLKWLNNIKKKFNISVATEVANKNHVKLAIKYDIDILWIGARSTVSPFVVKEISDELKNTNKIILVKNPMHIDNELLIGALNRLIVNKIYNIGVIHRGFTIYGNTEYRNNPMWNVINDFRNKYPNIPIICDPSHISGDKNKIYKIIKVANKMNYNGFMIETHNNPNKALSDQLQQITPKELNNILNKIKKYKNINNNSEKEIDNLRIMIDEIDHIMLSIINSRMEICKKIGIIKKSKNIPILQSIRYKNMLNHIKFLSSNLNLSRSFIKKIINIIHKESVKIQEKIIFNNKL